MIDEFREAVKELENRHVREWKEQGKKIVGYTCSYVPDEIFYAAGILPCRIRGFGAEDMTIGDTYFGPFICSLPKCMLQLAGSGSYSFLDGAVITPGCDSMRRLDECWRKAGEDIDGILPDFFFHFGVPHKLTDYTVKWFMDEIKRIICEVERHFNVKITQEKLIEAIREYNRGRKMLYEFDDIRTVESTPILGGDALAVILAATAMPRDIYNDLLEKYIIILKESGDSHRDRVRIMLVGSADDDISLVEIIEGQRAAVIADNLCFGARFHLEKVSEEGDPVEALARRYLGKNECPRMYGGYRERLYMLKEKAEKGKVDGVILQNIRFCDLHGAENGLFERDLEKEGIPCMRLEREYGTLVESGRVKMRVHAFIERLEQRRATA